jgi:hypothetical protein
VYVLNVLAVSEVCCKCFIWMLYMLQWLYTYITSVCFKCFAYFRRILQQVLHIASIFISRHGKTSASGGGPRVHAQQHGVHRHANNSRHMQARAAGACEVLENLVLIAGAYDNDRLQLPCFDEHASLETRPPASASRSKIMNM